MESTTTLNPLIELIVQKLIALAACLFILVTIYLAAGGRRVKAPPTDSEEE